MQKGKTRNDSRKRRHVRVRKRIHGRYDCPRLNVFRSVRHVYVQAVDDDRGVTLAAVSTLEKEMVGTLEDKTGIEKAKLVGEKLAERLLGLNISKAVFDRGGYTYHGLIKSLADGVRSGGINF